MGEEAMRVARSVAAACLLNHYDDTKPVFTPIVSDIMVAHLNSHHLISPSEKEALLKAAGYNPEEKMMISEEDSEDTKEKMISEEDSEDTKEKMIWAIGKALVSIEKDTGAVTCFLGPNLDGPCKYRVYALSIRPDILAEELLPISLRFRNLAISPAQVTDAEEYQRKKEENIRPLKSTKKLYSLKCPDKYITKPETTPTSIHPHIQRRLERRMRYKFGAQLLHTKAL